jgi:hypothetical protein
MGWDGERDMQVWDEFGEGCARSGQVVLDGCAILVCERLALHEILVRNSQQLRLLHIHAIAAGVVSVLHCSAAQLLAPCQNLRCPDPS